MALAIDDSTAGVIPGSTSGTFGHTCTGTDLVLYVGVGMRNTDTVTGVTYNGVALSSIANYTNTSTQIQGSLWRLIAPDTGTHDVVVTLSTGRRTSVLIVSLSGADQTTPNGTPVTDGDVTTGGIDPITIDVVAGTGEIVIDFAFVENDTNTNTLSEGANQTLLETSATSNGTSNGVRGASSYESGAGTKTMSWTPGIADNWAQCGVAVIPAAEPPAAAKSYLTLLGVG